MSSRIWRATGAGDERVEGLSGEIEAIARQDAGCELLMSVPGVGSIISSAMVAAVGRIVGNRTRGRGRACSGEMSSREKGSSKMASNYFTDVIAEVQKAPQNQRTDKLIGRMSLNDTNGLTPPMFAPSS